MGHVYLATWCICACIIQYIIYCHECVCLIIIRIWNNNKYFKARSSAIEKRERATRLPCFITIIITGENSTSELWPRKETHIMYIPMHYRVFSFTTLRDTCRSRDICTKLSQIARVISWCRNICEHFPPHFLARFLRVVDERDQLRSLYIYIGIVVQHVRRNWLRATTLFYTRRVSQRRKMGSQLPNLCCFGVSGIQTVGISRTMLTKSLLSRAQHLVLPAESLLQVSRDLKIRNSKRMGNLGTSQYVHCAIGRKEKQKRSTYAHIYIYIYI